MMELLQFISEVGFPIAAACIGMYFVFLTQKFLLDSVLSRIKELIFIIKQLDTRVKAMSLDIIRIDGLVSQMTNLPLEEEKSERLKDSTVQRKD